MERIKLSGLAAVSALSLMACQPDPGLSDQEPLAPSVSVKEAQLTTPQQQKGHIAAVSRAPNTMEVLWISADGSVQDARYSDGMGWSQSPLAPPGTASPTGSIAAVSRAPNTIEVLFTGADGSVKDARYSDGMGWGQSSLAPPGSASLTGGIAAVSRAANTIEVLFAAGDGSVQDVNYYDGRGWNAPLPVVPANTASTTGGIAAVSRAANTIDVFFTGYDGSVQDANYKDGAGWNHYLSSLAPWDSASLTAGIAAVSRAANTMEVFFIANDGSVQDVNYYDGSGWKPHFSLPSAGRASVSGGIAAVSRAANMMEVFFTGADGSVQDLNYYDGRGWNGLPLAPAGSTLSAGSIAAVSRAANTMEVFFTGPLGSVQDLNYYDGRGWNPFLLALPGSVFNSIVLSPSANESFRYQSCAGSVCYADVLLSGAAADNTGHPVPGTRLRWSYTLNGVRTELGAGGVMTERFFVGFSEVQTYQVTMEVLDLAGHVIPAQTQTLTIFIDASLG